jgi:hypothetical protein
MFSLKSILCDLSQEKINQVVARGIRAGHGGSNSNSSSSNSMSSSSMSTGTGTNTNTNTGGSN